MKTKQQVLNDIIGPKLQELVDLCDEHSLSLICRVEAGQESETVAADQTPAIGLVFHQEGGETAFQQTLMNVITPDEMMKFMQDVQSNAIKVKYTTNPDEISSKEGQNG